VRFEVGEQRGAACIACQRFMGLIIAFFHILLPPAWLPAITDSGALASDILFAARAIFLQLLDLSRERSCALVELDAPSCCSIASTFANQRAAVIVALCMAAI
jgi:hypothetical protein